MEAVVIGAILPVAGAVLIVVFLGLEVRRLMRQDAERHGTR